MRADAESSCTESCTDSWSQDGARNPWSAPTTELWAPTPYGEVRDAWHAKETLRAVYDIPCAKVGAATVAQLATDLQEPGMPEEINRLGRTIWNWRHQISNWHAARVTNAPTEAAILWSVSEGVVDVADGHVAGCRGRVLWSVSLASAMLLAV